MKFRGERMSHEYRIEKLTKDLSLISFITTFGYYLVTRTHKLLEAFTNFTPNVVFNGIAGFAFWLLVMLCMSLILFFISKVMFEVLLYKALIWVYTPSKRQRKEG